MVQLFQRRTFVQRNVVGLVALDFVLRLGRAGVMDIALVINVGRVDRNNFAGDPSGFRIPSHMIADVKFIRHAIASCRSSQAFGDGIIAILGGLYRRFPQLI